MSRLNNLVQMGKELLPKPRLFLGPEIALGCGLAAAVFYLPASPIVTGISMLGAGAVLMCTLFWTAFIASSTDDKMTRRALLKKGGPEISSFYRGGMAILLGQHAMADKVANYAGEYPQLAVVILAISSILLIAWCTAKVHHHGFGQRESEAEPVIERHTFSTESNRRLVHSSNDINRLAAFTAGRLLCFAHTPYLSAATKVVLENDRSIISYKANDSFNSIQTLEWMVYEGLAGTEAEARLVGNHSDAAINTVGDITAAMDSILRIKASVGGMPVPVDPASPAEVLAKSQRMNQEIRRRLEDVKAFLDRNSDSLNRLYSLLAGGQALNSAEVMDVLENHVERHPQMPMPESCAPITDRPHLTAVTF